MLVEPASAEQAQSGRSECDEGRYGRQVRGSNSKRGKSGREKNKLGETRAWANSATAKTMQALFFCLTHQLFVAFELLLEKDHGIRPERELKRRARRLENDIAADAENNQPFPSLRARALRLTQHTVKLLRWLRASFLSQTPWLDLIAFLRYSYAVS